MLKINNNFIASIARENSVRNELFYVLHPPDVPWFHHGIQFYLFLEILKQHMEIGYELIQYLIGN